MISIGKKLRELEFNLIWMQNVIIEKSAGRENIFSYELEEENHQRGFHHYDSDFCAIRDQIEDISQRHEINPEHLKNYESILDRYRQLQQKILVGAA